MSVIVEIENPTNLRKARDLAGVNSDGETIELALEKYVQDFEAAPTERNTNGGDLPQSFWDDLFSEPMIPSSVVIKAFEEEREGRF